MTIMLFLTAAIALFLLVSLVISISNIFVLRSLKDYSEVTTQPKVSILVPARDEETDIGNCVRSLLAQDYPDFEVIVLDDHSSDGTWQILQGIAAEDSRLKIDRGMPLPEGWLGKHWVCHQLAQKADGEFLLFTDADTVHNPSTLKRAVSALQKEKADLITVLPRQIMQSFTEKLIMPFSYWFIMSFLPLGLAYRNQVPQLAAATGQFMLFRKSAYQQIGGFASVRNQVVDDVELCRKIRSSGLRWRLLDGHDDYSVRQYASFNSLIEGHTKNLFAELQSQMLPYIAAAVWLLTVFLLPIFGLIYTAGATAAPALLVPLLLFCVRASLISWLISYLRFRLPWYMALFYPVIAVAMAMLAFESMRLHFSRKATWKGRIVSPGS